MKSHLLANNSLACATHSCHLAVREEMGFR